MEPFNTPQECDHDSSLGEEYVDGAWVVMCSRCCPCKDCSDIRVEDMAELTLD